MSNKFKKFISICVSILLSFILITNSACTTSVAGPGDNSNIEKPEEYPQLPGSGDDGSGKISFDNIEEFVYSLIYSDLSRQYETSISYCSIKDTSGESSEDMEVYGISYVDYEDGYVDEDDRTYFSAGFISFPDEIKIPQSERNKGLEIISIEEEYNDEFSYVYSYDTEDVRKHCVYDNKYIKYEIVDNALSYTEEPYVFGMDVDESRGNIYNYDTEEFVYIVEELDYIPVTGTSLLGEAEYEDIIEEVNNILATQTANLSHADLESFVEQSQDALYSYFLGLQEETFMGVPTSELVKMTRNLDPMQHLKIAVDENGYPKIELIEMTKIPTLTEKILTSFICAVAVVGGVALSCVGLPMIGGAVMGAGIEVFSQVVISNVPVSDIEWAQVAVAAAAGLIGGGVSGAINGIAVQGVKQLVLREAVDLLCDSIIGGAEFFASSLIAGQSFEDACKNFGYGMVAGLVIGGALKGVVAGAKAGVKAVKKAASKNVAKVGAKSVTKLSTEAAGEAASELQERAIKKSTKNTVEDTLLNAKDAANKSNIIKKRIKSLPGTKNKNWEIVDINGKPLSKADLLNNGGNGYVRLKDTADVAVKNAFKDNSGNAVKMLKIADGAVDFSGVSKADVFVGFTTNRLKNFKEFDKALVNVWSVAEPEDIPADCYAYLTKGGKALEDVTDADIARMRSQLHLTWDENIDLKTAKLVSRQIHNVSLGGISHSGGISYLKIIDKLKMSFNGG